MATNWSNRIQFDLGCVADIKHHLVLADNSIMLEGGITHISMPRIAEMGMYTVFFK